ncbi:uracil-DNA glycosylase family protein [Planctomicrobium sp. SH661]|uniref:uracil-DNA glycosylase n=1 Tax=Planctomicrobium sp. SH661 TaxID=3448124 RepID=UPI003F5BA3D3
MTDLSRAARQLLRDWQSAGLTHLPRVAVPERPLAAAPGPEPRSAASSPLQAAQRIAPASPAPRPEPRVMAAPSVSNLEENHDPLPVRQEKLSQVAACVAGCVRCPQLASTRTQTVFGVGNAAAKVMFIGEAPGADEDRLGEPFVGKAGQLLTKIIQACGWQREEIYICNILRCRPPENRTPTETEAGNCREYLDAQIAIVDPEYIVCWGSCAAQNLLGTKDAIGKMRQRFYQHGRAKVLCTYHPSYLLRNPAAKKPVWDDMKFLLAEMGLTPPAG